MCHSQLYGPTVALGSNTYHCMDLGQFIMLIISKKIIILVDVAWLEENHESFVLTNSACVSFNVEFQLMIL